MGVHLSRRYSGDIRKSKCPVLTLHANVTCPNSIPIAQSKAEELQEVREELAAAEKELRQKSRKTQVSYGEEVILG